MDNYLESSEFIDWQHPAVMAKAMQLSKDLNSDEEIAQHCFEFVRDEIKHSWDFKLNPVTCKASDVLNFATGYCYAKSHLLAALLRANKIPTGLCYQRLAITSGPPYCLHGLNAVYLQRHGWYRLDPRGNKANVCAEFCPPQEKLAFSATAPGERDLHEIWHRPHPAVISALNNFKSVELVFANLPDISVI